MRFMETEPRGGDGGVREKLAAGVTCRENSSVGCCGRHDDFRSNRLGRVADHVRGSEPADLGERIDARLARLVGRQ